MNPRYNLRREFSRDASAFSPSPWKCTRAVWRGSPLFLTSRRASYNYSRLLRHCAATKHPLFSNGAGKAFVSQLLSLSSITGEQWVVRSSTTSNPLTDWCGVVPGLREPAITGVVDILLQTMAGEPLLVGEVKSRVVPRNSANLQLVAELRMRQRRTPKSGIVGLLVDPSRMYLYLPQLKGDKYGQNYSVKSKNVANFGTVLRLLSTAFAHIRVYSGKTALPPAHQMNVVAEIDGVKKKMANLEALLKQLLEVVLDPPSSKVVYTTDPDSNQMLGIL